MQQVAIAAKPKLSKIMTHVILTYRMWRNSLWVKWLRHWVRFTTQVAQPRPTSWADSRNPLEKEEQRYLNREGNLPFGIGMISKRSWELLINPFMTLQLLHRFLTLQLFVAAILKPDFPSMIPSSHRLSGYTSQKPRLCVQWLEAGERCGRGRLGPWVPLMCAGRLPFC